MADNVTVDNGTLTDYAVASDDDGTAQHQYVKNEFGADGVFTKVTTSSGLPVAGETGSVLAGVADDAAISGNTLRVGARASNANPTAMSADGDMVSLAADRRGQLFVLPGRVATATLANVASSATNVTLQAANTSRMGWILFNDSTAFLYVKYGATASATSFTYKIDPGGTLEMAEPVYTGIIDGIWTAADGSARLTEMSA